MKSSEIREKFLNYFENNGHKVLPGSSLIPSDPSVLLTLAGMLQFKPIFLGIEKPKSKRVTTVQKCMRMNDIENVGHTSRHQTFFEMLGNFSFGDYFKKEAISFAWELLTSEFKITPEKLLIAVFKDDNEAYTIWNKQIGIPAENIFKLGEDNNFWAAGPTGPCGPCSEIYYDLGIERGCGKPDCSPGCDCDRFLEVWNLVFIQYNRDENGNLHDLPSKNIDTGMGLERIASILQNVPTNFDTDLFVPILKAIDDIYKCADPKLLSSKRIVADHIRAIVHLIADQVIPSNEGRGYVLRRIIRRAVHHGRLLGIKEPFLYKLVPVVSEVSCAFYPDLKKDIKFICQIIKDEEEHFRRTLEQGMETLDKLIKSGSKVIPGADAFLLHDTYGFPFELTNEIAKESGIVVDEEGFKKLMEGQKQLARTSTAAGVTKQYYDKLPELPNSKFEGYTELTVDTKVIHIDEKEKLVVLEKTTFYPEAGGQVGDTGKLIQNKKEFEVVDTVGHIGGVIIHKMKSIIGLKNKTPVKACVDPAKRKPVSIHHTATHVLHATLRELFGKGVRQSGSFVSSDGFRFDFSHTGAISKDDIERIERRVNEILKQKLKVDVMEMPIEEAKKLGALMFFGEKYGEHVRMIQIGDFSRELCGGTHIKNTSEISFFKIMSEGSVSSGIRRIEATAGDVAKNGVIASGTAEWEHNKSMFGKYETLELKKEFLEGKPETYYQFFRITADEIDSLKKAVDQGNVFLINRMLEDFKKKNAGLVGRIHELEYDLEAENLDFVKQNLDSYINSAVDVKGVKVIRAEFRHYSPQLLRKISDLIKQKVPTFAAVLFSTHAERVALILSISQDLVDKGIDASALVKVIAKEIGGGGGGKKNIAEAGGHDHTKLQQVFDKLLEELRSRL